MIKFLKTEQDRGRIPTQFTVALLPVRKEAAADGGMVHGTH